MCGCYKIDVMRALFLQVKKYLAEASGRNFFAVSFTAYFIVLAEAASQRASAEKDGAASADTADTWLFPMMKGSSGGCDMGRAFAVTGLLRSVCPAVSGTEIAGTVAE